MRSDAALSALTEEQQADLFDWLTTDTYEFVLKRIAQPPPGGFGLKTHVNSLYRFYHQRQAEVRARDLANLSATHPPSDSYLPSRQEPLVTDLSGRGGPAAAFYAAASTAFAHSTYILANSPLNPATYRAVSRALHQHEDIAISRDYLEVARQQLALARERHQLDKTQFEYNAARAAIALLPELIAIDQLTDIDDESKIWRVRDRLFGASSATQTPHEKSSMIDAQCEPKSAPSASSAISNDLK